MLHEGLFGDEERTCFLLAALEMAVETVTGAADAVAVGGAAGGVRSRPGSTKLNDALATGVCRY